MPLLDMITQDQTLLSYVGRCLKNLMTLDLDRILGMYIFQNFSNLQNIVNSNFLVMISDVVIGAIVSETTESRYKYEFIENVIKYLLEQGKTLNSTILAMIIQIFNTIWSVFPVLPQEWSRELLAQLHPKTEYKK